MSFSEGRRTGRASSIAWQPARDASYTHSHAQDVPGRRVRGGDQGEHDILVLSRKKYRGLQGVLALLCRPMQAHGLEEVTSCRRMCGAFWLRAHTHSSGHPRTFSVILTDPPHAPNPLHPCTRLLPIATHTPTHTYTAEKHCWSAALRERVLCAARPGVPGGQGRARCDTHAAHTPHTHTHTLTHTHTRTHIHSHS